MQTISTSDGFSFETELKSQVKMKFLIFWNHYTMTRITHKGVNGTIRGMKNFPRRKASNGCGDFPKKRHKRFKQFRFLKCSEEICCNYTDIFPTLGTPSSCSEEFDIALFKDLFQSL